MSKDFYTNIATLGNNILFRGVKNGRRVRARVKYSPTLFMASNKPSPWKNLQGDNLEPTLFTDMKEARDFVNNYSEVSNFKIFGNTRFEYAYIAENYPGVVDWSIENVAIDLIDIEVGSENGFPNPYQATEPVTAIGITRYGGQTTVYGCGPYEVRGDEKYVRCADEFELLKRFMSDWQLDYPDVISGWNVKFFDIPYLFNRIRNLFGDDEAKKLSPWTNVRTRSVTQRGREQTEYELLGISTLDYLELYRWYAPNGKSQESYKLGHIAKVELGEDKLDYSEHDNLNELYKQDHQKFIEYNIQDVGLVQRLDDKLKLLELGLTLAYDTKSNYNDIFAQTRMWDSLIYNYLYERKIIVPPKEVQEKDSAFEGAYVKVPQVGMHEWVASFDLDSLYPHLIMQYNISPETLIEPSDYSDAMRKVIMDGVTVDKLLDKKVDLSAIKGAALTPNGQFFDTTKAGFLPTMLEEMYDDRKKFKNLMLQAEQEYENETDPDKKYEISKTVARYKNLQLAKKVGLNSAYGAMGSQYFRFYDLRMALGVTMAGQLSIRWIENKINQFLNTALKTQDEDYVIASDTDSIYLRFGPIVNAFYGDKLKDKSKQEVIEFMDQFCEKKLKPFIDSSYKELAEYVKAYNQKMRMKREVLADKGIWTAKKRYILNVYNSEGVQYSEPHLKVMGLEVVKSSTPQAVRNKMKELIKLTVMGTEDEVQDFIAKFREDFRKLRPEEVSFPRGVNGLKEYSDPVMLYKKGTPIHVKGAIIYNHLLDQNKLAKKYQKIKEGEKLKFCYLKRPNPTKDTVISFPAKIPPELGLEKYVDYDMQFEKTFIEPIKPILDCVGWGVEKTNSLESFFG